MSKSTNRAHKAMAKGEFEVGAASEKDLLRDAKMAMNSTIMEDETVKTLRRGTVIVDEAFAVFDAAFSRMSKREVDVEVAVKKHVSVLKDKANQVGEALARIDKLAGHDFELKLQRLERFANAVETLDKLNKSGRLGDLTKAMAGLSA